MFGLCLDSIRLAFQKAEYDCKRHTSVVAQYLKTISSGTSTRLASQFSCIKPAKECVCFTRRMVSAIQACSFSQSQLRAKKQYCVSLPMPGFMNNLSPKLVPLPVKTKFFNFSPKPPRFHCGQKKVANGFGCICIEL